MGIINNILNRKKVAPKSQPHPDGNRATRRRDAWFQRTTSQRAKISNARYQREEERKRRAVSIAKKQEATHQRALARKAKARGL